MRLTYGFAALALTLLASSSVAQCPGGMNFELTALTVPQPVVAPLPKLPSAPPPAPPKKKEAKPKKKPVPARPAPPPEPESEPEAAPPPQAYPQRNRTDAALDAMIGEFGSRPRSGPNIDYSAPMTPNQGLGEALRQDAAIRDHFGRRHRDRERERRRDRTPRQPTTPQETTPQSTPQSTPKSVPQVEPCPGLDSSTPLDVR